MNAELLLEHYERIAEAPNAIARLRRFILDLAVRGKLVEQDPNDEPASELLTQIAAERAQLVMVGEAQKAKNLSPATEDAEFDLPQSWSWARLSSITSYIQRGKSPAYAEVDGLPVVSQKCVQWSGLNLAVARLITKQSLEKYEKIRFLQDGDLLWNSTGTGTIGRIIKLESPHAKLVCDSHVTVVRCLRVNPEYIRTWLRSDHVYGVIEDRAAGSTNQVELTAQMALSQVVPLPPLAEQHRIVAKVDELMALCDQLETAQAGCEMGRDKLTLSTLAKLNDPDPETFAIDALFVLEHLEPLTKRTDQINRLRQTILNLAVRGKLVEQDPNDEPASELLKRIAAEKARAALKGTRGNAGDDVNPAVPPFSVPGGWVWCGATYPARMISDVGRKVQTKDVLPAGKHPVVDQGKVFVRGYCNDDKKLIEVEGAVVVFGDHTRETKLIDFPFVVGADGVKILEPIEISPHFYHLCLTWLPLDSRGYGRHFKLLRQSYIPIPPNAEQHRIVAKVDELMTLCDQLEASLTEGEQTRSKLLEAVLHEALEPI
jgi:type I restriction enzyme S subunit